MILKLQVVNDTSRREPTILGESGGTIGRAEGNHLLLPDPFVSNAHARITFDGVTFLIEDTSSNGICINSPANKLNRRQKYPLTSGDLLIIDPYEIKVTIEAALETQNPEGEPAPVTGGLDAFLKSSPGRRKARGKRLDDLPPNPWQHDPFRPPDVVAPDPGPSSGGVLIPEDWDKSSAGIRVPSPAAPKVPAARVADATPTPLRQSSPSRADLVARKSGELSELLIGAGLSPDLVTPELARDFGRIIRIIVTGLHNVLKARQELKEKFRMHQTRIEAVGNNPLKFTVNAEDALQRLFVKNPAYLEPVAAFQDAFDDVLFHQVAMLEGMRVAYESMLKQFDPEVLQAEFEKRAKGGLISVPAKLRYWDQYREKFGDIVRDADSFQTLFGEEFAIAYDDMLDRLKAGRRSGLRPDDDRSDRSRR